MKSNNPWAPYEATPQDPWDLRKVAHLHRRAGFCATWSELSRDMAAGPAESIDRLLRPQPTSQPFEQIADALKQAALRGYPNWAVGAAPAWWMYRMTYGPDPLGERLTLFWHNHFATGLHGVYSLQMMVAQNELFRKHARGKFGDLLRAVEADPAMLRWLNGSRNHKDHPNENFARELMELFTLGIGHYTEQDVREAARGLTGWRPGRDDILNETDEFIYEDKLADTGSKKFLGREGRWRHGDILSIILDQDRTAEYLVGRLYRAFISENGSPDAELVQPLAAELRASNYSIEHVVGLMLRSRHFFCPAAYRQRVKSPVELCVGTIRQLEPPATPSLLSLAAISCGQQGQVLFDPPSVKGWEGGTAWLNSATTLARLNWVVDLLSGNEEAGLAPYDVRGWAQGNSIDESKLMHVYSSLLLQDDMDTNSRDLAGRLANGGAAPRISAALQVLMQTLEYHLA